MTETDKKLEEAKEATTEVTTEEQKTYTAEDLKRKSNDFIRQITELKDKLNAIETEKQEQERKRLEEQNEFKTLYETEKQKAERLQAEYEQKIAEAKIDNALLQEGVNNEFLRIGLKAKYLQDGSDVEFTEWIKGLKNSNPDLFSATNSVSTGNATVNVNTGAKNSTITLTLAREYQKSSDPEKRAEAIKFFEAYYRGQAQ